MSAASMLQGNNDDDDELEAEESIECNQNLIQMWTPILTGGLQFTPNVDNAFPFPSETQNLWQPVYNKNVFFE